MSLGSVRVSFVFLLSILAPILCCDGQTAPAQRPTAQYRSPATPQQNSSYDDTVVRARSLAAQKNFAQAATVSEQAIQMDDKRWEGYVVAAESYSGQHLYDDAIGMLQMALVRAPEDRKPSIRDAITQTRQMLAAPTQARAAVSSPPAPTAGPSAQAAAAVSPTGPTSQAEIVLWKTIENSKNSSDYQAYLDAYPNGVYAPLANRRIQDLNKPAEDTARAKSTVKELLTWIQQNATHDSFLDAINPSVPTTGSQDVTSINGCVVTYVVDTQWQTKKGPAGQRFDFTVDLQKINAHRLAILPAGDLWVVKTGTRDPIWNQDLEFYFKDRATAADALDKLVEATDLCSHPDAISSDLSNKDPFFEKFFGGSSSLPESAPRSMPTGAISGAVVSGSSGMSQQSAEGITIPPGFTLSGLHVQRTGNSIVVLSVDPSSRAASAGVQPGDTIDEIDHRAIRDAFDYAGAAAKKTSVLLLIKHGGSSEYLVVQPD